jgi:hypothetical protein
MRILGFLVTMGALGTLTFMILVSAALTVKNLVLFLANCYYG